MMNIQFEALPAAEVEKIRRTRRDAYGQPVHQRVSDGAGTPCRHCLQHVPEGQSYLILAHRPFGTVSPYAETGPIFLCESCERAQPSPDLPAMLDSQDYIVRGYSGEEWIVYGTGRVVETPEIADYAHSLLKRSDIAFVDVRSARNNCFQCRVRRAS